MEQIKNTIIYQDQKLILMSKNELNNNNSFLKQYLKEIFLGNSSSQPQNYH